MKKVSILFLSILLMFTLVGCKEEDPGVPFEAVLSIDDISLMVDDVQSIVYELSPAGTLADVTLDVTESSVPSVVSINNLTITAIQAGTATIEATATNRAGGENEFEVSTTFTVTVTGSSSSAPGQILNGGFEDDLNDWEITSPYGTDVFSTEVVDNNPHGGTMAFSLWYDANEDATGEAIDVVLSQDLNNIEAGTYLFSLWYQGTAETIALTIKDGDTILEQESFAGTGYDPVPDHLGYVQVGVEVTLADTTNITVEIDIDGPENGWGYIDDVGFNLGTLDDLLLAPQSNEDGYINFVDNGDFSQMTNWTTDIIGEATSKTANITGGTLQIWTDGTATFDVYQTITVTASTYHLVLYINGGVPGEEFNASSAYAYIDDGTTMHTVDLEPIGWNTGLYTRLELIDLSLSGEIEVGVHIAFDSGTNNWINIDDIILFSEAYPVPTIDELAAMAVDELITALPDSVDVDFADETAITAARAAYDGLTTEQQALVTELDRLVAIEAAFAALDDTTDEDIAAAVDNMILALPNPLDITLDDELDILATRGAYDALTVEQQALVVGLDILEAAEAALAQAAITEEGYFNMIAGGEFNTLDDWTISVSGPASGKSAVLNNGHLEIWANGSATIEVAQTLTVQDALYNLTMYINGGYYGSEFNVDEAYAYAKVGETTYELNIIPQGWNNGNYLRIERRNIPINGEVEVGIYINFTSGTNNWVNIDDFTLWSLDFPVNEEDQTAAEAVITLIDALPAWEVLSTDDTAEVTTARNAYDALTPTQQLLVSNYLVLTELEERLTEITSNAITLFNTEGTFESDDWTMASIGWSVDGGNAYTDGDTANSGGQSYNFFKDQTTLTASIFKPLTLDAGEYDFIFYLQGGDYTSITVTIGDSTQTYTATDVYQEFTLTVTHTGGVIDVQFEVVRPSTTGWVTVDDLVVSPTT